MKKIYILLVIVFALALNSQDANAQQRPEDAAKIKVAEATEALELNGEQQRALFRAFVKKEAAYAKQITGKDITDVTVAASKKDIDATFEKDLQAALTPEQYKKYIKSIDN